jgi:hypothetical protein
MASKLKGSVGAAVAALVASIGCSGYDGPTSPTAQSTTSPAQPSPAPRAPLSNDLFVRMAWGLSGLVFEITPSGPAPVPGVSVYCDACGEFGHTWTTTNANGVYRFSGDVAGGGGVWIAPGYTTYLIVNKDGYQDPPGLPASTWGYSGAGWRELTMTGDAWFDIQLVKR